MRSRSQVEEQRCYATDFQAEENNINALPRDMLVKIFQQTDAGSTAIMALVCQTWHRATEDAGLWRYFCMFDWSHQIRWSVVDEVRRARRRPSAAAAAFSPPFYAQVTEDFLEEYGWNRLYREIHELGKSETVMTTQSQDLRETARVVRERMERSRCVARPPAASCAAPSRTRSPTAPRWPARLPTSSRSSPTSATSSRTCPCASAPPPPPPPRRRRCPLLTRWLFAARCHRVHHVRHHDPGEARAVLGRGDPPR